jgi:hypothetical protein
MQFIKKEWKTVLPMLWLVIISVFLLRISSQLNEMHIRHAKVASTLDSVESIVLSTDSGVVQVSKKVGEMETNVDFMVERMRRR